MTYRRRKVTDLYIYLVKDPKTGLYREATVEEIKFNKKKTMKNKKPDQAEQSQAEEIQAEEIQAEEIQAEVVQAQPVQAKPDQAKQAQAKPIQAKKEEGPKQIKVKIQVPAKGKAKAQIKAPAKLPAKTSSFTNEPIKLATPTDVAPTNLETTNTSSSTNEPIQLAAPTDVAPTDTAPIEIAPTETEPVLNSFSDLTDEDFAWHWYDQSIEQLKMDFSDVKTDIPTITNIKSITNKFSNLLFVNNNDGEIKKKWYPEIKKELIRLLETNKEPEQIEKKKRKLIDNPAYFEKGVKILEEFLGLTIDKSNVFKVKSKSFYQKLLAENNAIFQRQPEKKEIVDFLEFLYPEQYQYIKDVLDSLQGMHASPYTDFVFAGKVRGITISPSLKQFLKRKVNDALIQAKIKSERNIELNQNLYLMNFLNILRPQVKFQVGENVLISLTSADKRKDKNKKAEEVTINSIDIEYGNTKYSENDLGTIVKYNCTNKKGQSLKLIEWSLEKKVSEYWGAFKVGDTVEYYYRPKKNQFEDRIRVRGPIINIENDKNYIFNDIQNTINFLKKDKYGNYMPEDGDSLLKQNSPKNFQGMARPIFISSYYQAKQDQAEQSQAKQDQAKQDQAKKSGGKKGKWRNKTLKKMKGGDLRIASDQEIKNIKNSKKTTYKPRINIDLVQPIMLTGVLRASGADANGADASGADANGADAASDEAVLETAKSAQKQGEAVLAEATANLTATQAQQDQAQQDQAQAEQEKAQAEQDQAQAEQEKAQAEQEKAQAEQAADQAKAQAEKQAQQDQAEQDQAKAQAQAQQDQEQQAKLSGNLKLDQDNAPDNVELEAKELEAKKLKAQEIDPPGETVVKTMAKKFETPEKPPPRLLEKQYTGNVLKEVLKKEKEKPENKDKTDEEIIENLKKTNVKSNFKKQSSDTRTGGKKRKTYRKKKTKKNKTVKKRSKKTKRKF